VKQQLSKIFTDKKVNEAHVALGYIHTNKEEAEARLKGVSGHQVQTITRQEFEAMSQEEETEPGETLEVILEKRDSKAIQELIDAQAEVVKKAGANVIKARSERVKKAAQTAFDLEGSKLESMTMALQMRLEEEAYQQALEEKANGTQEANEQKATEAPKSSTEETTEASQPTEENKI
jgi:hypothetical protein